MMAEIEQMVHCENNMKLSTNQYKYGFLNIRKRLKIQPPTLQHKTYVQPTFIYSLLPSRRITKNARKLQILMPHEGIETPHVFPMDAAHPQHMHTPMMYN
jgi:hypothetical protein